MTKEETIQVLQSIEDRASEFPNMTECDLVVTRQEGVEQGKAEMKQAMINKACEWLRKELVNFEDYNGIGEDLIKDFRKAIEE